MNLRHELKWKLPKLSARTLLEKSYRFSFISIVQDWTRDIKGVFKPNFISSHTECQELSCYYLTYHTANYFISGSQIHVCFLPCEKAHNSPWLLPWEPGCLPIPSDRPQAQESHPDHCQLLLALCRQLHSPTYVHISSFSGIWQSHSPTTDTGPQMTNASKLHPLRIQEPQTTLPALC